MPTVKFFFGIGENCIGSINCEDNIYLENYWEEFDLRQHFGCNVKSIALHAQILMFGLEDGSIHLLYIAQYYHVIDLEDMIQRSNKIEVDTEPIVDLTVLEADKKPCIVAVTREKVPKGEVTFPNEIWLEIFKWIDSSKLLELRLVCHQFYDLIEYLFNKHSEWKYLANETILYDCLEMTMQRAYPYELVSHWLDVHDPELWRGTYFSYKKWQKVLINPHTKDTIVPTSTSGYISCMHTFDKYIAIAFDNGSIACYTIDNISQPFYLANHGTNLIRIVEFWYSCGDVLVVSVGHDYALKFWDLQNKIEIATDGFFANSISSGECRHFCIGDMGGVLTSYERVGNRILPGPTLNLKLRDDQQLIAHAVDGIYMTAIVLEQGGTVHFMPDGVIEGGKLIDFVMVNEKDWNRLPENLGASIQRVTVPTVAFFFGIGENCIGSTNYYENIWHEYNLRQHFGCNVMSIALHAQILMFGLENGSIHLLYIAHYGYVIELEERIQHSKKIEVDTMPIVDLTVLEVDKKPCIVAVTREKVHLINFF